MKIIAAAMVVSLAIIGAAAFGRYEIVAGPATPPAIFRIDRLTGRIEACFAYISPEEDPQTQYLAAAQPKWCAAELRSR